MRDVSELYAGPFKVFEWFSMAVFSIEYGLRVWTCTVKPEFSSPIRGRIRYIFTPSAIIDLVVVIPFYLRFFFDLDLRLLRVLRLFRLFALFKIARYSQSLQFFKTVVRDTKEELLIVVANDGIAHFCFRGHLFHREQSPARSFFEYSRGDVVSGLHYDNGGLW